MFHMRIQPQALERLKAGPRGEALGLIFEYMLKTCEVMGSSATEQVLTFQDQSMIAEEGDLVPIIILALRPANVGPTVDVPANPAPE